jgi:acetyl/propionyl-CoA carboxylase alpha subunit/acetyl-CoA carboxylase carboxyltransferase component
LKKLLIANRGEIAIRIARTAAQLGVPTVAIYSADDSRSLHVRAADEAIPLRGEGPAAYLDVQRIVEAATGSGCDALHPGYGLLSESAEFAELCAKQGVTFVGPSPRALELFGDKLQAKQLAERTGVPVLGGATTLKAAEAYFASLGSGAAVMVKAVAGGGGRGIRLVRDPADLPAAFAASQAEAASAFGVSDVFVERYVERARHVEVQILGDQAGSIIALGERDCTIQRRNQKVIEMAPAISLEPRLRDRIIEAAIALARAASYDNIGTVEFLVDCNANPDGPDAFAFMEANPRLQVEHTVTEAVTGVDLVQVQLRLAEGARLNALGLSEPPVTRGVAIQLRINAETLDETGNARPSSGVLTVFEPPLGPGIRVDTAAYAGYHLNPLFDSLLAKIIVSGADLPAVLKRADRALKELKAGNVATNSPLLAAVLQRSELAEGRTDTRWLERHLKELLKVEPGRPLYFPDAVTSVVSRSDFDVPEGTIPVPAPMSSLLVSIDVEPGGIVQAGDQLCVVEAMKMQHPVLAGSACIVRAVAVKPGTLVAEGQPILFIELVEAGEERAQVQRTADPDFIRPDLAGVISRHALTLDESRPEAVARRRKQGRRTARENLQDLFDPESFCEYGALSIAAQRRRRTVEDLERSTPADGLVAGTGSVNAGLFGADAAKCVGLAYDYTVLAGTQGHFNHKKCDRLFEVAARLRLPVIFYTEGGGGRSGDVDAIGASFLDTSSFHAFAKLSGEVPRISVNTGFCFAGNAVFLGCSDVIIATKTSSAGLGGPAMIEGGGLGVFRPEEVGPAEVLSRNGVIDVLAGDDAEATHAAKTILSYFQGAISAGVSADQRLLRHAIPENRARVYDVRRVIELIADTGTFTELRRGFAAGMITGLLRVEGRPLGLIANDPRHLGGAIDSDGADKASRFMQLCGAFALPILSLIDTPGFMVGPASEATAAVRHGSRMFVTAAGLPVPVFAVILRRGYGLGAQAMAGGSLLTTAFTVSWPSGEFGPMGLEGAVRLGFRKELEASESSEAREVLFQQLLQASYDRGKAVSVAQYLEIDAVIDPAETRHWISRGLSAASNGHREYRPRFIDTW